MKVGEYWNLVIPVKVFRDLGNGILDVHTEEGDCLLTVKENLTLKIENDMKAMKDAVLKVAQDLAKANNTVTTLEIKTELRRDYPYYFWDQATVSNYMAQLAGDGIFTYTDNGTYRTYSLAKPPAKKSIPAKKISSGNSGIVNASKITRVLALNYAQMRDFNSVKLASGKVIDANTIRNQKKSPLGYIKPKLHNVVAITVGKVTYQVY